MNIKPLEKEHLVDVASRIQGAQTEMKNYIDQPWYFDSLTKTGEAYSVLYEDKVVLCAGIIPQWDGRYVAWALFTKDVGLKMVSIMRAVRRFLNVKDVRRVEAYIDCTHLEGIRLAELLGFKFEGTLVKFTPDGRNNYMYARTKD